MEPGKSCPPPQKGNSKEDTFCLFYSPILPKETANALLDEVELQKIPPSEQGKQKGGFTDLGLEGIKTIV
ncbi:hypothetical protein TS65_14045 [Aneurinibacillus migulanus]|uniref:Uncharacterized protein n=1 Tax=Aneurinibacillus migulanus TaxID=47500 RepID=A0A0D1Y9Q8_ANEMI|nr:hypothetical protein TS65_14045 [Aneurinibacillus migulanus]KON97746.1 hypothetical protein AF333_22235 [Aneurinibacillus migulanus]GED18032.1 hypothetical protein AMI01nite_60230 [Aneurinibacillus migulanus]SDK47450.1 hypothetical protein SAMN04487909_1591 [Aneurinibacillus migulanus]